MSKLAQGWTVHLHDQKDKANFESALRNSTLVMDRMRDILNYKLDQLEEAEASDAFFETENLDQRFYRNQGRKKELRELLRLLAF